MPQQHHAALPPMIICNNNNVSVSGRSQQYQRQLTSPNHGRRGLLTTTTTTGDNQVYPSQFEANNNEKQHHHYRHHSNHDQHLHSVPALQHKTSRHNSPPQAHQQQLLTTSTNVHNHHHHHHQQSNQQASRDTRKSNNNSDSLRYEYDDHYFLTDPDEFIYEFFPLASEWQLIRLSPRPITLNEFEQLPFVRSLFFKYGLYFPQANIRSVLYTDSSGATTIKIGMPTHMIPSLIFHYNLKYYDSDLEHFDGISLKRFVMQSVESG